MPVSELDMSPAELPPGTTIGRYVVSATLGRGGMGIVYDAHDPELDRRVALKVLSTPGGGPPLEQTRLRREALALAKLSHANVVAVYDVGTFGERLFLAMERVEGVTLTDWLVEKPRSWEEVLVVFRQAGEGLAAAHAAGLIHRDFKPDNTLVDRQGRARVLDFGLARAADRMDEDAGQATSVSDGAALASAATVPTSDNRAALGSAETVPAAEVSVDVNAMAQTVKASDSSPPGERTPAGRLLASPLTATGALMGTPYYMSPEQHRGLRTDARTDQFSFCVALYEALYGQRPFRGDTMFELGTAVVEGNVVASPKGSLVPDRIQRAVLRGLRPAPADRFSSMEALLAELSAPERGRPRRAFIAAGIGALGLAAVGVVVGTRFLRAKAPATPVRYKRLTFHGASDLRLSPDGQHIAYVSAEKLIVRDLARGTERTVHDYALNYFLHWISETELVFGFFNQARKEMGAVPIDGGPPRALPLEAARSADRTRSLMFRLTSKNITIVELATGAEKSIPVGGTFTWLHDVVWSPRAELLLVRTEHEGKCTISAVALDGPTQRTVVHETLIGSPCFSPHGDAVYYVRDFSGGAYNELAKIQIDPQTGTALGPPRTVSTGLNAQSTIAVSPDGQKLFFTRGLPVMQLWMLDIPDSPGEQNPRIERIPTSGRYHITLAVSPDGKLALVAEVDSGVKLTTIALEGGTQRQIASSDDLTSVTSLAWSPDGTEIAMTAYRRQDGRLVLYRVPTTGGTLQTDGLPVGDVLAWAPSAQLFVQMNGNQNFQVIDPATSQSQPLLTDLDGWLIGANISPNGKTIACLWNRKSIKGQGIGLISIADRSVRFLEQGDFRPVGFSPDGTLVYAVEMTSSFQKLVAISIATSAVTPLATLPFETGLQEIVVIPGTSRFLCLVSEGGPDLWVAEGFDPEAAAP